MKRYVANADYEDRDSAPLFLEKGDIVTTGVADTTWPGWIWAESRDGSRGYVPEEILEAVAEDRYRVVEAYDPTVLSLKRGDVVESIRQIHRWHWCRNQHGKCGWVADYLLREQV
ncbi:MAG: hypothetical protein RLZZ224_788 [Verrucomicrobiota bacterium]|jgi:hypothetical protein